MMKKNKEKLTVLKVLGYCKVQKVTLKIVTTKTWDESYPDLQETKLEITKNSNGKYTFKEYYFQDGSSSWENAPFTYYPTLSGTTLTVTPHIMDCWDTAKIKSLDKTKLVLECVGDDGNENWYTLDTYVRAK